MAEVIARPGESFESLMRRFKRAVERSGVLSELKLKEYYEKPSQKRKRKEAAARKREAKRQEKVGKFFKGNQNFRFNKDHTVKIPLNNNKKPQGKFQQQTKPYQGKSQGQTQDKPYNKSYQDKPYNKPYQGKPSYNKSYQGKPYQNQNKKPQDKPQNKG